MDCAERAFSRLAQQAAVWVTVDAVQGSVPREVGAWMAVFEDAVLGTVGGGQVEFAAIAEARRLLGHADAAGMVQRYPLGPALGQCCGGVMHLRFEPVGAADLPALRQRVVQRRAPVALFGGGHVGQALVEVLARLPFALTWIDSRDGIFPQPPPADVRCEHSDPVQGAVDRLDAGSAVLVMSFSHAEDLDIVAQCLRRQRAQADLASIGLIGSATKWARFRHRLEARGFTEAEIGRVRCPIGLPGIVGKQPAVIAVAIAAQLLQDRIV